MNELARIPAIPGLPSRITPTVLDSRRVVFEVTDETLVNMDRDIFQSFQSFLEVLPLAAEAYGYRRAEWFRDMLRRCYVLTFYR